MSLIYKIALSLIPGIGPKTARKIVSYMGGVKEIFHSPPSKLKKVPGVGDLLSKNIADKSVLNKAEQIIKQNENKGIIPLFYLDSGYPSALKEWEDAPVVLYVKGNFDFENKIYLSVVGTRKPTDYGYSLCRKLFRELKEKQINPVIISGLAYGIDYCAHKEALNAGFETIAVLGHGLDTLYPAAHKQMAKQIENNGCLLTEFPYGTKIEAKNFVRRNRIIAALADATVVVQSAKKGGSLITAEYAISYSKPVYTFPGRVTDDKMSGCNFLIKTNRAALIEGASDLIYDMNWQPYKEQKNIQKTLFTELSEEELKIVTLLKQKEQMNVDFISYEIKMPVSKVLTLLFSLEFKGVVKALPGRMYALEL